MGSYRYFKLAANANEMRLISLLPGSFNDRLQARILHVPLATPKRRTGSQLTLDELKGTLPEGWTARQTLEGRYLFRKDVPIEDPEHSTWTHPVPDFANSLYEGYVGEIVPHKHPTYEALSYVWGTNDSLEHLTIISDYSQSGQHQDTVSIGQNLSCALRHLRDMSGERVLWVDAICIDQDNKQEHSDQVLRMADIYRLAWRVVIWLWPSADDSGHALSTVDYLSQQLEFSIDHFLIKHPNADHRDWHMPNTPLIYDQPTLAVRKAVGCARS